MEFAFGFLRTKRILFRHSMCLFLFGVCLSLASCADLPSANIQRSGISTIGGSVSGQIYWIDSRNVLLVGVQRGDLGRFERYLFKWSMATGATTTLANLGDSGGGLCYEQGYVRYVVQKAGHPRSIYAGPLGNESVIREKNDSANETRTNPFNCREYNERDLRVKLGGGGFWPLKDEHGYWGARESTKKGKSLLVSPGGGKEIELSMPYQPPPRWSEFSQAYVFRRLESLFSDSKTTGRIWLLKPDGQVKTLEIPPGEWFGGSTGYDVAKPGVFIWSHAVGHSGNGAAGGYLMRANESPRRFIEGYIHSYAISPDGCKIALNVNTRYGVGRGPELVVANICSTES